MQLITNNTEKFHCTLYQFPPVVTPCKATAQFHNQDTDIDIVMIQNIYILKEDLSYYPCRATNAIPSPITKLLLNPGNHSSVLHSYNSVISKNVKLNHMVHNLLGLLFHPA